MESGIAVLRDMIHESTVSIHPFAWLPGETSRFFADHMEFLDPKNYRKIDSETVFHSEYFWWGSGQRVFDVILDVADLGERAIVELRIHTFKTLASQHVDCVATRSIAVTATGRYAARIHLATDEGNTYAILAKMRQGSCVFTGIDIRSYPAQRAPATITAARSLPTPETAVI